MEVSITKDYLEKRIHNNIGVLADAKNIQLDEKYEILSGQDYMNKATSVGLFTYEGIRDATTFYIVFISQLGKYMKKSHVNAIVSTGNYDQYIIILPIKKSFKIDDPYKNVEFIMGHETMISDVPGCHREFGIYMNILTDEEVTRYMNLLKIPNKSSLPKIKKDDVQIIYSPAIVGDIVQVFRPSLATSFETGELLLVVE